MILELHVQPGASRSEFAGEHGGRLTRTLDAPHEHSAVVYEYFLNYESDRALRKLARTRWAGCLLQAGAQHLNAGEYRRAAALFSRSLAAYGGLRPTGHDIRFRNHDE